MQQRKLWLNELHHSAVKENQPEEEEQGYRCISQLLLDAMKTLSSTLAAMTEGFDSKTSHFVQTV